MKWYKLKENKCPKCGDELMEEIGEGTFYCNGKDCDFKISEERFSDLVSKMVSEDIENDRPSIPDYDL